MCLEKKDKIGKRGTFSREYQPLTAFTFFLSIFRQSLPLDFRFHFRPNFLFLFSTVSPRHGLLLLPSGYVFCIKIFFSFKKFFPFGVAEKCGKSKANRKIRSFTSANFDAAWRLLILCSFIFFIFIFAAIFKRGC